MDYDLGPTGHRLPAPPAVDPASVPLPIDSDDDELPPAHMILHTMGAQPAQKVAGSRQPRLSEKAKGKQRAVAPPPVASGSGLKRKASTPLPAPADTVKRTKGRVAGAANYSSDDLDALFDILEESLPLGGHAWNSATDEFNAWAEENGRPTRTAKSLELKFKQVRVFSFLHSIPYLTKICNSSSKPRSRLVTLNAHPTSFEPTISKTR